MCALLILLQDQYRDMCLIIETPMYFDVAEMSLNRWPSEHQSTMKGHRLHGRTLFIFT